MKKLISGLSGLGAWASAAALAQATPGGIALQPAQSALAEEVHFFHNVILMPVIVGISLFVLALLLWVMVRYNARLNPTPRKFSHNTLVEVIWTGVPILILLVIALPSFDLLYKEDVIPDGKQSIGQGDGRTTDFIFENRFEASTRKVARPAHLQVFIDDGAQMRRLQHRVDYSLEGFGEEELTVSLNAPPAAGERVIMNGGRSLVGPNGLFGLFGEDRREVALAPAMTLKVTGNQWNWTYAYPEYGDFDFISNMAAESETTPELYLLEVDNRVIVPVGETIRVTVTASDVIHAWALPSFAIKIDAVPGRINETWFKADREGVYYGQCSEICGIKHAFMPIAVEAVSVQAFCRWIRAKQSEFGVDRSPEELAAEPLCGDAAARLASAGALAR